MFEEINKHRAAIANNIKKSFDIDIEKAHQVGDVHPNGKYVWTEYKPGKFDFRAIKKNEKTSKATTDDKKSKGLSPKTANAVKSALNELINAYNDSANDNDGRFDQDAALDANNKFFDKISDLVMNDGLTKEDFWKIKDSNPSWKYGFETDWSEIEGFVKEKKKAVKTDSGSKKEADYDVDEYKRQRALSEKVPHYHLPIALAIVKDNLYKKEKELSETQSKRPSAKVTIDKLKNEVKYFKGQKKAIEEVLAERDEKVKKNATANKETSDKKTASEPSFKKKHYFKNVRNMAGSMNVYLEDKVDIQPFVEILGETVHDKGPGTRFRNIRAGQGVYGQSLCKTDSYLQNDYTGDFLQFKKKPTEKQLDECAKLLKEKLWADGYKVEPKFYVKKYNDAYQAKGTYGIGIRINVNEENFKASSK